MALRFLYILFIGIIFAFFVGIGIDTFYHAPKSPEYPRFEAPMPISIDDTLNKSELTKEQQQKIEEDRIEFEKLNKQYQANKAIYNVNVSIIAIIASVFIVILSVLVFSRFTLIADGLLLGGIFTLGYALIRAIESKNDIFRFLVITLGLVMIIYVGHFRFIKNKEVNF